MRQELEMIGHQVNQLDLVVYQHQLTRQLFTQISKVKEEANRSSNLYPSKAIQLTKEDQERLQKQEKWADKIARESHQWRSKEGRELSRIGLDGTRTTSTSRGYASTSHYNH